MPRTPSVLPFAASSVIGLLLLGAPVPATAALRFVQGDRIEIFSDSRTLRLAWRSDGPAAVDRVTLYVTRDGGSTWSEAVDAPVAHTGTGAGAVEVTVPADGTYGFTIVAVDAAGRMEPAPGPGDPPENVVHVDTLAPRLDLRWEGDAAHWEADDGGGVGCLHVWIEWAPAATGPWHSWGGRRPPRGHAPAPTLPADALWVRVRTEDRAGNTSLAPAVPRGGAPTPVAPALVVPALVQAPGIAIRLVAPPALWDETATMDLWRSTDHGATWEPAGASFTPDRAQVELELDLPGWHAFTVTGRPAPFAPAVPPDPGQSPLAECRYVAAPPAVVPPPPVDADGALRWHREAWARWLQGDRAGAAERMLRARSADPGRADLANDLGAIRFEQGLLPEAVDLFREAVRMDPTRADYAYNLGYALLALGRPAEAEAALHAAALVCGPDEGADVHWYLGEISRDRGDAAGARWHWQQVCARSPQDSRWGRAARARLRGDRSTGAGP